MELSAAAQVTVFAAFAAIAVAGALGMTTTMSMFRSAVFLMASFMGVAGLFILLAADLLGLLQVMMYVGGMLVMALFMVLFSRDPGGAMMSAMPLRGPQRWFSAGIATPGAGGEQGGGHAHAAHDGASHDDAAHAPAGHAAGTSGHGGTDTSMSTPIQKPAALLALATGGVLVGLLLIRSSWPVVAAAPDPRSAERVGELLMGKYMVAFEGAGLMILLGIFAAAYLARPGRHPDPTDRQRLRAAAPGDPEPVAGGEETA